MKKLLLMLLLPIAAFAAPKWNEDLVGWTAPTQCSDGSPIAGNCDVTGYLIETASSATATTWATVTPTSAASPQYLVTGLSAGLHCYRVTAQSAGGSSTPSNVACSTATPPAPNAPVLKTVDTLAYSLTQNRNAFAINQVGTVPLAIDCKDDEANGLHVVPRDALKLTVANGSRPNVVLAKCS